MFYVIDEGRDFCTNQKNVFVLALFHLALEYSPSSSIVQSPYLALGNVGLCFRFFWYPDCTVMSTFLLIPGMPT